MSCAPAASSRASIKSGIISDCGTKATIMRQDNGALVKGLIGGMSTLTEGNRAVELTRCYAANTDASALPLVGSATEQLTLTSCHNGTPVGGNGIGTRHSQLVLLSGSGQVAPPHHPQQGLARL
ncbi:MAG: hypothetical protein IKI80_03785 [Bacteroidaceae bacterium]|nr:hypothetical protein [Bacteroidaceae bacterium]